MVWRLNPICDGRRGGILMPVETSPSYYKVVESVNKLYLPPMKTGGRKMSLLMAAYRARSSLRTVGQRCWVPHCQQQRH